jgi:uncharacterized protein YdiU (UPF0061 family)
MSKRVAPKLERGSRAAPAGTYASFDAIDGRHPWQTSVPEGFVAYPVRMLERGKVAYFNFSLAREMGLISATHGDEMTPALEQKIIETFSIQIVNEYDQQSGARMPRHLVKEHPHMATRYLQLQHANKRGRTSGDGRSVWNGSLRYKGTTWDISSRGTGVTCLAPGAVLANRPLKTGEGEFGYGCGLADVTELLGSALLSEIFHLQGISTERVLTVIDLGKGCGIGVRAAPNLIRPAHLFLFLKQERLEPLRQATDYLIQRQCENGAWKFSPRASDRYRKMLTEVALNFARFASRLEREYIFAWMDWDGDNVLASGGIIDYGSIRQFGLRHDQYRYDDVERFSTNLNEQRGKARLTVQVFAQLVSYLETGKRRAMEEFDSHAAVRDYDREFDRQLRLLFLAQVGFDETQSSQLMSVRRTLVEELYSSFLVLEKTKTKAAEKRLPDGLNRPAVFNMRAALRELPHLAAREGKSRFTPEEILEVVTSSHAKRADLKLKGQLRRHIMRFEAAYANALHSACGDANRVLFLKGLAQRSEEKNRAARITGNGAEFVVEALIKARRKGFSHTEIQIALDLFIASQVPKSALGGRRTRPASLQSNAGRLFQELVTIAQEFEEDI